MSVEDKRQVASGSLQRCRSIYQPSHAPWTLRLRTAPIAGVATRDALTVAPARRTKVVAADEIILIVYFMASRKRRGVGKKIRSKSRHPAAGISCGKMPNIVSHVPANVMPCIAHTHTIHTTPTTTHDHNNVKCKSWCALAPLPSTHHLLLPDHDYQMV